jgi:hypothetical protein
MARKSSPASDKTSSLGRGSAEMPDDLRRRDPSALADLALANDDVSIGAMSPRTDGGSSEHPMHDQDFDDIETEEYESMVDDVEDAAVAQAKEGTHHLGEETGEAVLPLDSPLTEDEMVEDDDEDELIKTDETADERA